MSKDYKQLNVIIPLRSKSKGIKNKNLLKVGKYPLAVNCINTILKSGLGNKIIIATDSKDYVKKIKQFFKKEKKLIYFIRSKKSAFPISKTEVDFGLYFLIHLLINATLSFGSPIKES